MNIQYVKESIKTLTGKKPTEKILTDNSHVVTRGDGSCASSMQLDSSSNECAKVKGSQEGQCSNAISSQTGNATKKRKTQQMDTLLQELIQYHHSLTLLKPMTYDDYVELLSSYEPRSLTAEDANDHSENLQSTDDDFKINLLNSFVHPDVISLICKKLKDFS